MFSRFCLLEIGSYLGCLCTSSGGSSPLILESLSPPSGVIPYSISISQSLHLCVFLSFSLRHSSIIIFICVWLSSSSYASFHVFYFRTFIIRITIFVFYLFLLEVHIHTYLTTWLSLCPMSIFFGSLTIIVNLKKLKQT